MVYRAGSIIQKGGLVSSSLQPYTALCYLITEPVLMDYRAVPIEHEGSPKDQQAIPMDHRAIWWVLPTRRAFLQRLNLPTKEPLLNSTPGSLHNLRERGGGRSPT